MIVTAHVVKQPPSLTRVVHVAGADSDGRHCSRSPESIHDPLQGPNGQAEDIVGIAKVLKDRQVVGFIYRTASGRYYAQALASMPYADQKKADIVVTKKAAGHNEYGFAYSSIREIERIPWSDLSILPCR